MRGFLEAGYTREQAQDLMRKSVRLAREARDEFGKGLVALSMGCYGAVLANGAEYTGEYGSVITIPDLVRFHRERLDILLQGMIENAASFKVFVGQQTLTAVNVTVEPGIDFILFETVPSFMEAQAIRQLVLEDTKLPPVGVSFSCRSEEHVSDGTLLSECISVFNNVPGVFAVGVNCTKPKYIPALVRVLADSNNRNNNEKAILLYPDGGEEWDPVARSWNFEQKVPIDVFGTSMAEWDKVAGTRMILGGCCGTGPRHIASIRNHLVQS